MPEQSMNQEMTTAWRARIKMPPKVLFYHLYSEAHLPGVSNARHHKKAVR
jgi:hypothetical protein